MCFCLFCGPWAPCARPFSCFLSSLPVLLIICAPVPHCVSVFLAILSSSCACSLPVEPCLFVDFGFCLLIWIPHLPVLLFFRFDLSLPMDYFYRLWPGLSTFLSAVLYLRFFPVFWRLFCATCWAGVIICLNIPFKLTLLLGPILCTNLTIVGFYLKQSSRICSSIYIWHQVDF